MENKKAADRLIEIWDNIKQVCQFWDTLPKQKQPQSKSYKNVRDALADPFILAKLHFFSYVSAIVEPYLRTYQTEKPMIPFMFKDLKEIVLQLMQLFIKPEVLEANKSGNKLIKIDLYKKDNQIKAKEINVGFAVEAAIDALRRKDIVSRNEIKNFMECIQKFLCSMVRKIFQRSPLYSSFLFYSKIFDPSILSQESESKLLLSLKPLLKCLMELDILSTKSCDNIVSEFHKFFESELKDLKRNTIKYSNKNDRLDDFYFKTAKISKYENLSFLVKLILTLSHGQASIERGFSLNESICKKNMSSESLIAKRVVKDHMLAFDLKPHTIEITSSIVKAFKSGRKKYHEYLEEEKRKKAISDSDIKKLHINDDIEKLKLAQTEKQKTVNMLEKDFIQCMEDAEKNSSQCMSFVTKANALKRKSIETKNEIDNLEKQIVDLEEKKRKI